MRLSIFVFFLALYLVTTAGHIYTVDSFLNYAVTQAVGRYGKLEIPRFMMTVEGKDGKHYSKLGVGQSLVNLPFYWIGHLLEKVSPGNPIFRAYSREFHIPFESETITSEPQALTRISEEDGARVFFTTLTNGFVTAGLCVMFWVLLTRFGLSGHGAFAGTLLLGFSTPFWIYARDLFAEPLFALCLLGIFLCLMDKGGLVSQHKLIAAGALSSLGVLARASFIPIIAIFAVYVLFTTEGRGKGVRQAVRYCGYSIPGIIILASLNLHRFGSVFVSGYHTAFDKGFSTPLVNGLAWNLVSPYRSIFLYVPIVVLFFFGFIGFAKRYRGIFLLMMSVASYTFILYSKWWAWHGGWCWGPRFLLPILPFLLLPGIVAVRQRRCLVPVAVVLGLMGFVIQLGGILINYTAVYDYWIKIGKLDWAETNIYLFSPITAHLKGVLTTSASYYDLWFIQAGRAIGFQILWIAVGLAIIAILSLRRFLQSCRHNT